MKKRKAEAPTKEKPLLLYLGNLAENIEDYAKKHKCKNRQEAIREILKGYFLSAETAAG